MTLETGDRTVRIRVSDREIVAVEVALPSDVGQYVVRMRTTDDKIVPIRVAVPTAVGQRVIKCRTSDGEIVPMFLGGRLGCVGVYIISKWGRDLDTLEWQNAPEFPQRDVLYQWVERWATCPIYVFEWMIDSPPCSNIADPYPAPFTWHQSFWTRGSSNAYLESVADASGAAALANFNSLLIPGAVAKPLVILTNGITLPWPDSSSLYDTDVYDGSSADAEDYIYDKVIERLGGRGNPMILQVAQARMEGGSSNAPIEDGFAKYRSNTTSNVRTRLAATFPDATITGFAPISVRLCADDDACPAGNAQDRWVDFISKYYADSVSEGA